MNKQLGEAIKIYCFPKLFLGEAIANSLLAGAPPMCSSMKTKKKQQSIMFYQNILIILVYESTRLRESIFHTIGQSSADLESQSKASEYALRKRLHELERALKELEWQKKQVFKNLEFYYFFSFIILD